MNLAHPEYLNKAQLLSEKEQARILSRMHGQLPKRLQKSSLFDSELTAAQLEFEEERLNDWRKNLSKIRNRN